MLILVGPSASGKTQIAQLLIKNYGMKKLVTYTSRPMRLGEVDGEDYHFLTEKEFLTKIDEDFFLEFVSYNGYYYGTSFSEITADKVVILEPNGLKKYKKELGNNVKIAFLKCSPDIRRIRMKQRGDDEEQITKRLLLDKVVFGNSVKSLCDWVIETSNSNAYQNALEVYNLYKATI